MKEEREEDETEGLEEDMIPQIHYEVCYPRPRNKYQNYGKANKTSDGKFSIQANDESFNVSNLQCAFKFTNSLQNYSVKVDLNFMLNDSLYLTSTNSLFATRKFYYYLLSK